MERFRQRRHVLVVDDEFINRELLKNILEEDYDVTTADNGKEAWEMIHDAPEKFSLVLLDLLMPVMDGFQFLNDSMSDEIFSSIPIIVMTSEKEAEVKSIRNGAADFITKPYDMPEVILARVNRIIELYEDKNIIMSTERDSLTGLYTKDYFFEYIRRIDSHHTKLDMDAIVFNIDHFHLINEVYGRTYGNNVLAGTGGAIAEALKEHAAIACRPEADTFYVYCEHVEDYSGVVTVLNDAVSREYNEAKVRVRLGIYENIDRSVGAESRFDRAKIACDRIRGDYTRQTAFYSSELHEKSIYHEKLINGIDKAIEQHELKVFFQPKYDITGSTPRLRSAEALIRWIHPELGFISPGDFVPLFEGNGLVQKLDNFVWNEAAAQIRRWRDKYGITVPVSVNVSRIDIYDPMLIDKLKGILKDNGISENELMLEITESAYADDDNTLIDVVNELRAMGFKVEMDDFGSGYSSLNMITTIPIDVLKLDMKFVRNMQKDKKSLKLVEIVMEIAKFLDVPVVAEGVETESQLNTLKEMGCDVIQGYYFSKPVPPDEFETFIMKEKGIC